MSHYMTNFPLHRAPPIHPRLSIPEGSPHQRAITVSLANSRSAHAREASFRPPCPTWLEDWQNPAHPLPCIQRRRRQRQSVQGGYGRNAEHARDAWDAIDPRTGWHAGNGRAFRVCWWSGEEKEGQEEGQGLIVIGLMFGITMDLLLALHGDRRYSFFASNWIEDIRFLDTSSDWCPEEWDMGLAYFCRTGQGLVRHMYNF